MSRGHFQDTPHFAGSQAGPNGSMQMSNPPPVPGTIPQGMDRSQIFAQLQSNFDASTLDKMFGRKLEWLFLIPFNMIVPAAGSDSDTINIKNDAHFDCYFITGDFTTLSTVDDVTTDIGTNFLSLRFTDASNDLKICDDFIPADLFLSPGRVKDPAGTAGNPSNSLFYPFPFEHIFPASGGITIEVANSGLADNEINLLFWGKKLKASVDNTLT